MSAEGGLELGLCCAQVLCMYAQSAGKWRSSHLLGHTLVTCVLSQWGLIRFWLRHIYMTLYPDAADGYYFNHASQIGVTFTCLGVGEPPWLESLSAADGHDAIVIKMNHITIHMMPGKVADWHWV